MKATSLYAALAYAGALPFVACALLLVAGIAEIPYVASTAFVAATYAVAIVSFIGGIHWGTWQHARADGAEMPALLPWSNVLTLLVWCALLLTSVRAALLTAIACFAVLLLLDRRLCALNVISGDYYRVRRNVTAIVISSLLVSAYLAAGH